MSVFMRKVLNRLRIGHPYWCAFTADHHNHRNVLYQYIYRRVRTRLDKIRRTMRENTEADNEEECTLAQDSFTQSEQEDDEGEISEVNVDPINEESQMIAANSMPAQPIMKQPVVECSPRVQFSDVVVDVD